MHVYIRIRTYDGNAVLCRPRITSFSSLCHCTMLELHLHSALLSMSAGMDVVFKMRVCTDGSRIKECMCALIETLYDYCPSLHAKPWWLSTAQIGTKLLYPPKPDPVLYVFPLSHILGKLPLVPAGDNGTIPREMHGSKDAFYPLGMCDRQGSPGTGSPLFYINSWAMIWPVDYKKDGH